MGHKFFTCKIEEGNDLLDHSNKLKAFADQLKCLEAPMREEKHRDDFARGFANMYKYFIIVLTTMPMKELTIYYVTRHLMHLA